MNPIIQFDETEKQDGTLYTVKEIEKSKELKTVNNGLVIYREKETALQVTNQAEFDEAKLFCINIIQANKKIENKRKFFGTPYKDAKSAIDGMFNPTVKELKAMEIRIKKKMTTWFDEQERLARIERERIEKQNQKKIEKAEAKQEANPEKVIMPPVLKPTNIQVERTSRGGGATSTVKKPKKWRLIDFSKVSRDLLCIDEKKVNALVKADIVPDGFEVYTESNISLRA